MDLGLFTPLVTPFVDRQFLDTLAVGAEDRGFDSIWFGEHLVTFEHYHSRYPYSDDGRMPVIEADKGLPDLFTTLAYLAARTTTLRLGSGVCLVPLRNPVVTAKEVANIDWLSGGRFDFGVGLGWSSEEYEALHVPWSGRGRRCTTNLKVMIELWRDGTSAYPSDEYELPPCLQYPKPVQSPHPPIFVGGESEAALRRVAEIGQGWYAFRLDPAGLRARLRHLEKHLTAYGRDISDIEVVVCPYRNVDATMVESYREAGASRLLLTLFAIDRDNLLSRLDKLAALL